MLTRIEIDGFKSFEDFSLDLLPFSVILGMNAAGKSNLFDAIKLLAKLADKDIKSAFLELRGNATEIFRKLPDGTAVDSIKLAAEALLMPTVKDPWGKELKLSYTRLRYEVTIKRVIDDGLDRLLVHYERATTVPFDNDKKIFPRELFRSLRPRLKYGKRNPFLDTTHEEEVPKFILKQDQGHGRDRIIAAPTAATTVLSTMTDTHFLHLFALREEFRSYRFLELDAAAMRNAGQAFAREFLESNGSNLATVLFRLKVSTSNPENPKGVLSDIGAELANLVPGIMSIDIEEDEKRREYQILIDQKDNCTYSARVASDGTLRLLALLTMIYDPRLRGPIFFEEPENGIHPARLRALIRVLDDMTNAAAVSDLTEDEAILQIVCNSHSPVVLSSLTSSSSCAILFADTVTKTEKNDNKFVRRTRMRKVDHQGRLPLLGTNQPQNATTTAFEVDNYLANALRDH